MKMLIVEDDHLQADWIRMTLESVLEGAEIECVKTEFDFRERFEQIANDPPSVVVMDVMLRWADPGPSIPSPPDDVRREGFYRAGLRCSDLMNRDARTAGVPVILYSVLEHSDLEADLRSLGGNVVYLRKEADSGQLIDQLRSILPEHFLH
jgi:CheY-like chemotaxis protein